MRLAILAALAVVLGIASAHADPVSIGATIASISGFLATPLITAGGTTLLTIGNLVATGALAAASLLLNRPPGQQSIDPGQYKGTFTAEESPEINGIGRFRIGGVKFFGNTRDDRRYRLLGHINGPWDGPEEHYLGGREVIVDSDVTGNVTSPPWVTGGGSLCHIFQAPGTGAEAAWSALITDFPSLWTSDHRLPGIAQTLIRFDNPGLTTEKFVQLYQSGIPDYEVVCRGQKNIYDPRTATHKWTDNGILCCLYILLLWPEITMSDIDMDFIADEADKADALVATLTGTEKRSRLWGIWSSEETREATLTAALASAGAKIVQRPNDKIGIALIDDIPTSERSLNSRFIKSAEWKSGPDGVDRPNIARVKYYAPERNFQMCEIDLSGIAWAQIDDEVDRYGPKYQDFEYKLCPSASQAQRNARREFALLRADAGTLTTQMPGMAILGCDYFDFDFDIPSEDGALLIENLLCIPGTIEVRDGGDQAEVEIPYRVVPTLTAFNPATDEAPAPPQVPDLTRESDIGQPSITAGPTVVIWPGGAGIVTRYAYGIPSGATGMEAVYRTYLDAYRWNEWKGMVEVVAESGYAYAYQVADLRLTACDFRVRGATAEGDLSKWSPTVHSTPAVDNTAPDAPVLFATYNTPMDADPYLLVQMDVAEDLNVSYVRLVITIGIVPFVDEQIPCGPGQRLARTYTSPTFGTYNITITSHASDDTSSASDSDSIVVS